MTSFITQYQVIAFVNITIYLIKSPFKYLGAVKLIVVNTFFNFFFFLKAQILSSATNTVSCFSLSNKLILFTFEKPSAKSPSLKKNTHKFVSHSLK